MYAIYSILYILAVFLLFIPQYLKRPRALRKKWFREKIGLLPVLDSSIWVHAVSVGEVHAAFPLLQRLRLECPDLPIVLSTITDTGQKVAMDNAPERAFSVYLPFDIGFMLKNSLRRTRPRILIVMETELWPNLFRIFSKNDIPVLVLNGRISENSYRGYGRISFFMTDVLSHVKVFGMQSRLDANRIREIGADDNKIHVLGNFKFDLKMPGEIPSWADGIRGPAIVAGSTHRGEEEMILSAFRENLVRFQGLKLILAPRHPERFKEVEGMLKAKGVPFVKRSELTGTKFAIDESKTGIVLLDSVGELSSVYGIADIAIIGKSFTGIGGQNPLEPAYWGKAIICGPHMENFPFIRDFYSENAAFEVSAADLAGKIRDLLESPELARTAGEKAKLLCMKNAGAVDRAMHIIGDFIGSH